MTTATSRRAILAGAAALPAFAIPAVATPSQPDPIFAAIEAHRFARAAYWNPVPGETDKESDDRLERTGAPADEALMDFLEIAPTTASGCIAALRHLHQHLDKYEDAEQNIMGNCTDDLMEAGAGFLVAIADALAKAGMQS